MDNGKDELSQEILETIKDALKDALREELWKEQVKASPLLQMLEAESVYIEEKKKLDSPPIEGALEYVTKEVNNKAIFRKKVKP